MRRHRQLIVALALGALATGCSADTFAGADASTDGGDASAPDATAPDAALDGGTGVPEASPPVQAFACGQKTCAGGETCCVYTSPSTDGGLSVFTACHTTCPAPSGGQQLATLGCTSTADCGSGVCCIHRLSGVDVSACEPTCITSNNEVQLCDPSVADAGCPASQPCSTANIADWNLPDTFATCGGHGVP